MTPHFRDFLPPWVARQPWYSGSDVPPLETIGAFRLEDPAGQVGMETQLVTDGAAIYQIPMTYRDAPLAGDPPDDDPRLIATAEHSVLGTRWIYDAEADPVWIRQMLHLVSANGRADPSARPGLGITTARGHRMSGRDLPADDASIEICRLLAPLVPARQEGLAGMVVGTWQPEGPDGPTDEGCLVLVRSPVADVEV